MTKYIIMLSCISYACFGINLPWSSGGSVEADMTVKNPERFAQDKFIPQYLDKAQEFLSGILRDKSLDQSTISKQKRDIAKDRMLYGKVKAKLTALSGMKDRLYAIMQRLQFATGQAFFDLYKTTYFDNLKGFKDKESDRFNLLKFDSIDQNRDCLYRYLSWNISGQKSAAQVRAMSYSDIALAIEELKEQLIKNGLGNSSFFKLMREMGAFFNDELAKEQYDAFVDGPKACNRLIIQDINARNMLLEKARRVNDVIYPDVRMKLLDAEQFLGHVVGK